MSKACKHGKKVPTIYLRFSNHDRLTLILVVGDSFCPNITRLAVIFCGEVLMFYYYFLFSPIQVFELYFVLTKITKSNKIYINYFFATLNDYCSELSFDLHYISVG